MIGIISGCVGFVLWVFAHLLPASIFASVFYQVPQRLTGTPPSTLSFTAELFGVMTGLVVYWILKFEKIGWLSFGLVWSWCLTEATVALRMFSGTGVVLYLLVVFVLLILTRYLCGRGAPVKERK